MTLSGHPARPSVACTNRMSWASSAGVELAIDLGGDEVLVEQRRGGGVGEALALHHVAPVAREIADGDEDQPVPGPGAGNEPPDSTPASARESCACSRR